MSSIPWHERRRRFAIRGCPKHSRAVWLTACSVLAAGCGEAHSPAFAHTDAARLITLAHRIAVESACGQARDIPRLRTQAIALVNGGRVPPGLQEPLMSAVSALGEQAPVCLPPVTTAPPPAQTATEPDEHGHDGHGKDHGKGHDK